MRCSRVRPLLVVAVLLAGMLAQLPARAQQPGDPFANDFFRHTWERTDAPVAEVRVSRTWVWGPEPFTSAAGEAYAEAPGGTRLVQYFDKSRMEINDPAGDPGSLWYVTNGLLARELITGRMQLGDNTFVERGPAGVNIAGDPDDPDGPTYASFLPHLDAAPPAEGAPITATIARDGSVGCCVPDAHGVTAGAHVGETDHRVADVFWDYLTSSGPIVERGWRTSGALFANAFYATGLPIGEAYWAQVRVAGVQQWVLVQPFERRVLTYTPGNAPGWEVEMGNVGRHYYAWRYGDGSQPDPPPVWELPAYPAWRPAGQSVDIPDLDAHYDLHISDVDVDAGTVTASETIRIDACHGPCPDRLYLQVVPATLGYFQLDALAVAGTPVTPAVHHDGLILETPLPADPVLPLTVELAFRLQVGREATGWGGTSLDSDILRLGYWFPNISDLHGNSTTLDPSQTRAADYDVTLDVAPDVVVAHAGDEVGREELGDGRVRYRYAVEDMRDFALVLARDFAVTERVTPSGVTVRLFSHPSSEGGLTDEAVGFRQEVILDTAVDALEQLSALVGPYPWAQLSVVDVGPTMPGGLEFPGLIYINPAYQPLDRLLYHEVAHQWLHAIVGNRTLIDPWIDEGGAEFFERGLPTGFTERPPYPAGGYSLWLDSTYLELPDDPARGWYYSIYEQGAQFYYDVLAAMGWDPFWRAFRQLYTDYQFDVLTAFDVLATFQEHSPTDLRPLFGEYFRYPWVWDLYGPGG